MDDCFWLSAHIEPIIKNKQMSEENNFDVDDVVNTNCIGGSGVEEKSSDDEIAFTNYILDPSLNLSLELLS